MCYLIDILHSWPVFFDKMSTDSPQKLLAIEDYLWVDLYSFLKGLSWNLKVENIVCIH